jgi:putative aldouronate transport system permease protein
MRRKIDKFSRYKYVYFMLIPGLLVTAVFHYIPLYGLYMAFSQYKLGKPILGAKFIGLKNFKEFIVDSVDIIYLLRNTLCMNIFSIMACLLGAMSFAIVINEIRWVKVKKIVQTASFFPFFLSWVIVYNIFSIFLSVESGVINVVLKDIGLIKEGMNFLGDPKYSWLLIVSTNLWKTLGYNSVLFLAAIVGIEVELFEAANIDGADKLQKIWHITIPALLPTLQVLLILNVGWIFTSNFDQYYLFTNALNRPTMEVFDMYIYRFGLKQLNYSYATAVGMAQSVAGVGLMFVINWASKKISGKGVF